MLGNFVLQCTVYVLQRRSSSVWGEEELMSWFEEWEREG